MTSYKVQSLRSLRDEMKAVVRGERPAPADAGKPSFNSIEALVRLLTPEKPAAACADSRSQAGFGGGFGADDRTRTTKPDTHLGKARGGGLHYDEDRRPPQGAQRRHQE